MQEARQYGFVDWSGDTGFKFSRRSSPYFILSLVSSDNYPELQSQLIKLKSGLGLPNTFEFHFSHNSKTVRTAFFTAAPTLKWEGALLMVDKQHLPYRFKKMSTPKFCSYFLGYLLERIPFHWVTMKRLLIDEPSKKSPMIREMRLATSTALSARNLKRIPKVSGKPAHLWDGIQVADMLAGALKEREHGGIDYLQGIKRELKIFHYEADK